MSEWVRFGFTAAFLILGVFSFASAVLGVFRFGYVLNRIHAAGIGDTMGLFFVVLSMIVSSGFDMTSLKLLLLLVFMWFTSPTSTHFLGQIEVYTNPFLKRHVRMDQEKEMQ